METNNNIKDFITLYSILLEKFKNESGEYTIRIYYFDDIFHMEILENYNIESLFKYKFPCKEIEYEELITYLCTDFIIKQDSILPIFDPEFSFRERKIYYLSLGSNFRPLSDKARIHKMKSNNLQLHIFYFDGINKLAYKIQDMALAKLNQDRKIKTYN